ncbi:MAG TPA: glycoside hydrolase family 15 protein, partial [Nitrospiraceae bacterium]|nr:glycoside hydrolase family 15 protein [Nitrospiraceae bacterium]
MALSAGNIEDYAVIGDSRTAALVSNTGSIDWLCLPRFDSPSLFNRLLDQQNGGHFLITPVHPFSARRQYQDCTAVLTTEFRTDGGILRVTDCMPVQSEAKKVTTLFPFRSVLRYIEGMEGTVELRILFRPRPNHARTIPVFHARGAAGYCSDLGNCLIQLATSHPLTIQPGAVEGYVRVGAGQHQLMWMTYSEDAPAVYPVLAEAESAIRETATYWKRWSERCQYDGPYRAAVLRSALTLKLLSYAPSGAIVAAPTTSLPEVLGGSRNWDYRYCWLRDASYTAAVFLQIGYEQEASAFIRWLLHATSLTYPALQVMYNVFGEASLTQADLAGLAGYGGSSPVRIGNQAHKQLQLDVYGEVLDALWMYVQGGHALDREMQQRVVKIADLICHQWRLPDHGIWEVPYPPRHYVHSKVMCWVALDRAERIVQKFNLSADVARWKRTRASIRDQVFSEGYSSELQSFVQTLGGTDVDATALTFGLTGFIEPNDRRVLSTMHTIRQHLGRHNTVYRYLASDGLPGAEGVFLPCSYWLVEALTSAGQHEEARHLFELNETLANDVGLFPEEMNHSSGRMLGNFPLALTHLAHIRAALRLNLKTIKTS